MKLFSPERPRTQPLEGDAIGGPRYVDPLGRPLGPIGPIYVELLSGGGVHLRVYAAVGPTQSVPLGAQVKSLEDLNRFFVRWNEDPEKELVETFGFDWKWERQTKGAKLGRPLKPPPKTPSLEDLGL